MPCPYQAKSPARKGGASPGPTHPRSRDNLMADGGKENAREIKEPVVRGQAAREQVENVNEALLG